MDSDTTFALREDKFLYLDIIYGINTASIPIAFLEKTSSGLCVTRINQYNDSTLENIELFAIGLLQNVPNLPASKILISHPNTSIVVHINTICIKCMLIEHNILATTDTKKSLSDVLLQYVKYRRSHRIKFVGVNGD